MILCLAKVSLVVVFMHLTPSRPAGIKLRLFTTFIFLWGLTAIFAIMFQCRRLNTWNLTPSNCYNQVKRPSTISEKLLISAGQDIIYYTNGAMNILTDLMILTLPAIILWNVQISRKRKTAVFIIFAVRIV